MRFKNITDDQLRQAVKEQNSYASVAKSLGIAAWGSSWQALKQRIVMANISTSHWLGVKHGRSKIAKPLILAPNTPVHSTDRMKKQLVKEGKLLYLCSECKILNWNEKPLSLQLDHINGDRNDQTITNLRLLCPNCHSQTSNYAGKACRIHPKRCCPKCNKPISKRAKICSECRWV